MITTAPFRLESGVIIPAGVRLDFDKKGEAKFQNYKVRRDLIPLQVIKGAAGPFMQAAKASVLNDHRDFQKDVKKQFPDYAHVMLWSDKAFVYIWDSREIIDVVDLSAYSKSTPIERSIKNPKTGETIVQKIGQTKPWLPSLYNMFDWPKYKAMDNGLPLVTKNREYADAVAEMNKTVSKKYSYESKLS